MKIFFFFSKLVAQPGLARAQAVGGRRSRRNPFPHHSLATREAEDDAGGQEHSTGRGDLGQTPGEGAAGSGCSLGDFRPSTCRWIGRISVGAVVPASHSLLIRVTGPSCWSAAGSAGETPSEEPAEEMCAAQQPGRGAKHSWQCRSQHRAGRISPCRSGQPAREHTYILHTYIRIT